VVIEHVKRRLNNGIKEEVATTRWAMRHRDWDAYWHAVGRAGGMRQALRIIEEQEGA
jgi:hypothetical protein